MAVSHETLAELADRHGLAPATVGRLDRLLDALEAEPDPPTSERTREAALRAHLADGLSGLEIADLAGADRIADLGAGAGFPGLVLAAALPHARVDLLESASRKCAVIDRLIAVAGIENARSVGARAEDWGRAPPAAGGGALGYGAVTARALGPLALLVEYAAPLLRDGGVLVAWKGARDPDEEAAGAGAAALVGMELEDVRVVVPFAGARNRHLHVVRKVAETPARFPRRAGMARKRPLA
ncbi:MAG TPA: RsmG family class I SAM-dependent methyltransferase [Thermoleophilaceae bacterium]|nr:RsmG family class I SAM-dependent methyltransferase [Thermoleophilaceae bacterium]